MFSDNRFNLTSNKGIILEGAFEKSFMYHAINEGFITPLDEEILFSYYKRARKRTEVLELCLLYDKVLLYAYNDSFDMTPLLNEDLIANIKPIDVNENILPNDPYLSKEDLLACEVLKPVVLPYLRRLVERVNSSTYDKIISLLAAPELKKVSLGDGTIPRKLMAQLFSVSHLRDRMKLSDSMFRAPETPLKDEIAKEEAIEILGTFFSIMSVYDHLMKALDLLKHSAHMSIPVATPLIARIARPLGDPLQPAQDSLDTYYRVF
jgi:hypothetical protein